MWLDLRHTLLMAVLLAGPASAAEHDHHSLAAVNFPISCSEPARVQFNQAITLLHHMTYPQAREAFEKTIQIEPDCAMAHWGVAMTLFQPLWPTRPNAAALARGWDEVQKAKRLKSSPRELLFIAAAEAFYLQPESSDYWLRIRRWEEASKHAYEALPGDDEAAVFYALSHLATTPATGNLREHADESAKILLAVYAKQPDHPGVMHYLIHANDVPGREHELLEITKKYDAIAPNNPHALHMPTHIYTRLGDWPDVIKGNLRAADAALLYPAGEKGDLVWDEYAHAIDYLVYAYLQQGADAQAAEQVRRLRETPRMEPSFKTAFHLASTQTRYALERRAWNDAVQIEPRTPTYLDWDRFMWAEATARFGRGLGAAHLGKQDEVDAAIKRLIELEGVARKAGEDLFARNIKVQTLELTGWSSHARGQEARGAEIMRQAAELEAATPKHPVTPGPTLPAYELLGDLYLEQKKPAQALAAYQNSLKLYPRRFNSLVGAAQAARDSGDTASARTYYSQLLEVASPDSTRLPIKEARQYLTRR